MQQRANRREHKETQQTSEARDRGTEQARENRRHRLLVVDDELAIAAAIGQYFEALGFRVDTTGELEEAQALIDHRKYSVVISDLHLRKISGVEGLELLAYARKHSPSTALVMLTAYGSPEIEEQASERGAAAFLHKPQSLSTLAETVLSLIEKAC